jgi:tetratricopeptide (TPR) repeat protein
MNNLKLFFQVYLRPGAAMSDIMDRGSWAFAVVSVLVVSAAFFLTVNARLHTAYNIPQFSDYYTQPTAEEVAKDPVGTAAVRDQAFAQYTAADNARQRIPVVGDAFFSYFSFEPTGVIQPLLVVSLFYIPILVLLISLVGKIGNYGDVIAREYGTLATCSLMAWAAAHLPFSIIGAVLFTQDTNPLIYLGLWAASSLLFGAFVVYVVRTVLGISFQIAIPLVVVATLAFSLAHVVFQYASPVFFLPIIVLYAFIYFRGHVDGKFKDFKKSVLPRQNYKRLLHEIEVNPSNADAHVQLAHVYRFRNQPKKALAHLKRAIEVDPREIEANYEFGKMARTAGDLQKALDHFAVVVEQDDTHALNEIWREIGATYLAARMFSEAKKALETFRERRPFDAEGLYYLGKATKAEGGHDVAREFFEQAVESVKVSPAYRRRYIQRWGELAEKEI